MLWYSEHENMRKPILGMTPVDQILNSFITTNTIPNDTRHAQFVTNSVFTTNPNFLAFMDLERHVKKKLFDLRLFFSYFKEECSWLHRNQFKILLLILSNGAYFKSNVCSLYYNCLECAMAETHTACVVIKKVLKAAFNSVKTSQFQKINFLSLP